MTILVWLGAGALGAAGAVGRYLLDGAVARRLGGPMPWGTLAVNALGSLVLGLLVGLGAGGDPRFLIGGALVGSFTTFSTWMLETHRLAEEGEGAAALLNLGLSMAVGIGAIAAGWALGAAL